MYGQAQSNSFIYTRILLAGLLILLAGQYTRAQSLQEPPAADLARTGILDDLSAGTLLYFSPTKTIPAGQLPFLPYSRGTKKFEHFIPAPLVNKKAILKFTLTNSSDQEENVFLCPGFYYDSIQLYKLNNKVADNLAAGQSGSQPISQGTTQSATQPISQSASLVDNLPNILPDDPDSLGYRKISLSPHETGTFFVALTFIKSPTNSINPTLTRDSLIRQGIIVNHKNKTSIDIITNLFAGIMLMMIFYSISEYLQTGKPHFLYYVGYAVCTSTLLFLKSTLHNSTTSFNFFFESFFDNIIFCLGNLCYVLFHRKFLETKKNYPGLDRYLFWGAVGITTLTILYILFFFRSSNFLIANFIEDSTKILLMVILVIFIIKGLQFRNQLMNYIVCGNISLCLLAIISQVMISTNFKIVKGVSVLNLALFHYEVGITIELLFFLFALTYKNKRELIISVQKEEKLKLETERKELEKQVAVLAATQDERNRISADMHDELGSGVTAIRLMSEIVKSKMKEQTLPEIEKISHSANELLNKMNTIIWTMTSSNDSVENLVAYIRSYAVEFFESTSIDCYFSMPASITPREISGEKRRNMFLAVKESLNNVLKHSQSSVVKINVTVGDKLIIEIQDDGVGINMEKLRKFGNGLNNMKKRMASINGEFDICNHEGTRTIFGLVL
ncbi:MAG TPA: 7TM diverse intracellular signaling domain-containing protein [Puia sp.]|nr:7TM diverse intracellular signaling domain-containing protein [Puia sp.]